MNTTATGAVEFDLEPIFNTVEVLEIDPNNLTTVEIATTQHNLSDDDLRDVYQYADLDVLQAEADIEVIRMRNQRRTARAMRNAYHNGY